MYLLYILHESLNRNDTTSNKCIVDSMEHDNCVTQSFHFHDWHHITSCLMVNDLDHCHCMYGIEQRHYGWRTTGNPCVLRQTCRVKKKVAIYPFVWLQVWVVLIMVVVAWKSSRMERKGWRCKLKHHHYWLWQLLFFLFVTTVLLFQGSIWIGDWCCF